MNATASSVEQENAAWLESDASLPPEIMDVMRSVRPTAGEAAVRYNQWNLTLSAFAKHYEVDELAAFAAFKESM